MTTTAMPARVLGRTGRDVSVVGLGCWQLGADWGAVSEDDAMGVLHAAVDAAGVTLPDTADVRAARQVAVLTPDGATTAQLALRWLIDQPGVSTVIPGARNAEQARGNAAAAALPPLSQAQMDEMREVYDSSVREHVHSRW